MSDAVSLSPSASEVEPAPSRMLHVSIGKDISSAKVKTRRVTIEHIIETFRSPPRKPVTFDDFALLSKEEQKKIKNGPFIVAAHLNPEIKRLENVQGVDIVTLDFDDLTAGAAIALVDALAGFRGCVYSTLRHTPGAPRYRIILVLTRSVTTTEYPVIVNAIVAQCAARVKVTVPKHALKVDPASHSPVQAMFVPAVLEGASYYFKELTGEPVDPDKFLASQPVSSADIAPVLAHETASDEQIEDLRSALAHLVEQGHADDRDTWIDTGQRLKRLGDLGYELWEEFSEQSEKYNAADCEYRWDGFSGLKTGFKAIFSAAQKAGWANPRTGVVKDKTDDLAGEFDDISGDAAPSTPRHALRLTEPLEYLQNPKPIQWDIEGLIEAQAFTLFVGPSGSWKSFFMVSALRSMASGKDFMGCRVTEPGSSILFLGEGRRGVVNRIHAWDQENGCPSVGSSRVLLAEGVPNLFNEDSFNEVHRLVKEEVKNGLKVVAFDTLARVAVGADENSAKDMGIIAARLCAIRDLGVSVWVVHHTGHTAKERARGSSSLPGAADGIYGFSKPGTGALIVKCTKMKDSEPPAPLQCCLRPVTVPVKNDSPISSAVIELEGVADFDPVNTQLGPNQRAIVERYRDLAIFRDEDDPPIAKADVHPAGMSNSAFKDALGALTGKRGFLTIEHGVVLPGPNFDQLP